MNYPYIIIDDDQESVLRTKAIANGFSELAFVASANNYTDGLNLILELSPKIIFLEIDPADKESNLSLALINELYRYLKIIPKIIITTSKKELAFEAIQYEVSDYILKPIQRIDLIKTFLKIKKAIAEDEVYVVKNAVPAEHQNPKVESEIYVAKDPVYQGDNPVVSEIADNVVRTPILEEVLNVFSEEEYSEVNNPFLKEFKKGDTEDEYSEVKKPILEEDQESEVETIATQFVTKQNPNIEQPLILCIKSYGDYRYIDAKDICYFQADNNSTDIHLNNGEMVTAFKTLKHFEGILSYPFVRIHNSYILNCNYISRIHTGNAVCYIKNSTTKLPFSKSYKSSVDLIISDFSNGNYLEI
ncbi:LytR/AlgR family response regulator transcription factor [Flavobacterium cellulosilyticum]|uniref:LytR/AlgR family response regulator transcription factor n=1 Tax=Flavobacterium cellulosilyticum TaxID=2541731 RepID=UPI001FE4CD14|nr:response regulator transcription factor [Flavobacterium cellulosilyticum]